MTPVRILFVCHGNICRSPMAEFVMKRLVQKAGMEHAVEVSSAATSTEELGNDMHPEARAELELHGVPSVQRGARQIIPEDYDEYDLLIGMDDENIRNMRRCFGPDSGHKVHKLLEYAGLARDVADPWYTGDFSRTYDDIDAGCTALLAGLRSASSIAPCR